MEEAWVHVRSSRLLTFVTYPMQVFEPIDPPVLPTSWSAGSYIVGLRFLGFLPTHDHHLFSR
jgi:hypothetical protein